MAVQLSAQCTDKMVNRVTPALFKKYPKFEDYIKSGKTARGIHEFEKDIHACGFYRAKTRNILAAAKYIKRSAAVASEDDGGDGEGAGESGASRRTFHPRQRLGVVEGIAVDTHVMRLSHVLGLSKEKRPEKIEQDLMAIIPRRTGSPPRI